ncbi:hypothetical protein D3C81_451700 [compost metagenome]
MKTTIYLRRKNKVAVEAGQSVLPKLYIATALRNLESLGYTFSEALIERVSTLSVDEFETLYKQVVKDLKINLGAHVNHRPMYPNFPTQVMIASEAELYLNAIHHYFASFIEDVTGGKVENQGLPQYEIEERFPLLDLTELKVIDLGTEEEFNKMISNLIGSRTSISETDKEDVEWVLANYDDISVIIPAEIPFKENVGFVVSVLLKHGKANVDQISKFVKTATDVLRLAVAFSNGDVSLAANTKFRKFSRPERRLLLGLLEKAGLVTEDMLRYKNRWIRLGEILHPSEYGARFKKTQAAFSVLRNNEEFETFAGKVEKALSNKDAVGAAKLLKSRPGEFARRLDHMLRITNDSRLVIETFGEVAGEVSTPVLLQVMAHFVHRNEDKSVRAFFPKGQIANVIAIENTLPHVDAYASQAVVQKCKDALSKRFAELPALGKVFVDKNLEHYLVPFSQRSASKALRTIVRGSKLDMPEGDTIRFFTYWKEGKIEGKNDHTGRVDIDLSAAMYDEDFKYIEHISWTRLRSLKYKAAHSGDITSAPNGASEFIDLDIPSVIQYGGRYVVMSLNSFTHHPYCDLPECFAGWMMRKEPKSGEIYEPTTVVDKIDLTADTQICIPVILDLVERKVIWTDLALNQDITYNYSNTIENNMKGMIALGKAMTSLTKPTLYELFSLHALSRGEIVDNIEEAETIFSVENGITPFDIEQIMAEFIV